MWRREERTWIRNEWQLIARSCGGFWYCRGALIIHTDVCTCRRQPAALLFTHSCSPKHISSVPCVGMCDKTTKPRDIKKKRSEIFNVTLP